MASSRPRAESGIRPWLGELDRYLLAEGRHWRAWERLGAHACEEHGVAGVVFVVWAPNASGVSVVGDFNGWDDRRHPMRRMPHGGYWEAFVPGLAHGALYKYAVRGADGLVRMKADPYAFWSEVPPATASRVWDRAPYDWSDDGWMAGRETAQSTRQPISIYEVHLGSWRRRADGSAPGYRDIAEALIAYVLETGFTHIELLPLAEYPFGGSWGYQPTALFAPTARWGTPDDLRRLVDRCHRAGIGVILDWVPAHFPDDAHGLERFDGTCLYEHEDPRQGRHPDWNTLVYNVGRREVANFLIANALFWLREFRLDGLRLDAVSSMLYLDYSRAPGEWLPNVHGGRENLDAIAFLRTLNSAVRTQAPRGALMIAEESTAWTGITHATADGGLGFDYKWNMGWMNDTLRYMRRDPPHRRHHHDELTFGLLYAHHERFILALSHDEVVHGKSSLLGKMPGDRWQRFANLRLYLAFLYTQPGKKLLFMGDEFGQGGEWQHDGQLDWNALADPSHAGVRRLVVDLNALYRGLPALHAGDCAAEGFRWIDCEDQASSVLSYRRIANDGAGSVVVVCNFTPVPRHGYRIGVPSAGTYREVLNTDAGDYGGSGQGNFGAVASEPVSMHGEPHSLVMTLPPLGAVILVPP